MGVAAESALSRFRVTVLIPTRDDACLLERTIRSVQQAAPMQILVLDAGSSDGTTVLARRCGVKVMRSRGERGRQLRLGLASAAGDVVLVVTPGVLLRTDAIARMGQALADPNVLAGVLVAGVEKGHLHSWLINGIYAMLRPFGLLPMDSPMFIWRTACHGMNSFRSLKVFAEQDLLRRIARKGRIVAVSHAADVVPAHEVHRLLWTVLQLPHRLRLSPRALQWLYRKPRTQRPAIMSASEAAAQASRSSDLTMSM